MMKDACTYQDAKWIQQQLENGMTYTELAVETGIGIQQLKRILAEHGFLELSWHKTVKEQQILDYLLSINLKDLNKLKKVLSQRN